MTPPKPNSKMRRAVGGPTDPTKELADQVCILMCAKTLSPEQALRVMEIAVSRVRGDDAGAIVVSAEKVGITIDFSGVNTHEAKKLCLRLLRRGKANDAHRDARMVQENGGRHATG